MRPQHALSRQTLHIHKDYPFHNKEQSLLCQLKMTGLILLLLYFNTFLIPRHFAKYLYQKQM